MPTNNKQLTKSSVETKDEDLDFFLTRKAQLKKARKNSGIEDIWRQADSDYLPHELGVNKKKTLVENERTEVSSYVSLDKDEWRSKVAKNEPFIKIQTALSVLFDRNPEAVFDPISKRFEANTLLLQQLYHRSWSNTSIGSTRELRKFIFNLGKYGFSAARRYYKRVVRKDMQIVDKFNTETNEFEWKKQDMIDVDDVYFESKNPFDVWIDDAALPDDPRSRRDWMWREVYDEARFKAQFPGFETTFSSLPNLEGNESNKKYTSTDLKEVFFYENRVKDLFLIVVDDKIVSKTPLPRLDKELSLIDTFWLLRSTENPYGIGLNEIMRGNKVLLDRIRNMTIDQVVLSIYKTFFYQNSETLDDEGGEDIVLEPGKGKKVIDPKNIAWFQVPGPGQDAYTLIEMLKRDIEDDTGVTRTLGGEITGKTLGEVVEAKQGALKRLATPLRNIKAALEWDAKLCVNLMKMVYSVPKVWTFTNPELIKEYIAQVNDDKDRYFVDEKGNFNAIKYREFQLNLEMNENGALQGTEQRQFFMVKPAFLDWEGEITIRVDSMIEMSRPLERQMKLEMVNILLPQIQAIALNPTLASLLIPTLKQLLKLYDEDPMKWLPAQLLNPPPPIPAMPPGMGAPTDASAPVQNNPNQAPKVVPQEDLTKANSMDQLGNSLVQKITPR